MPRAYPAAEVTKIGRNVKQMVLDYLGSLQEETGVGWLDLIGDSDLALRIEDGDLVVSEVKCTDEGGLEIGKTVAIFELREVTE